MMSIVVSLFGIRVFIKYVSHVEPPISSVKVLVFSALIILVYLILDRDLNTTRVHTSNIRVTYEYIRVHTSNIRVTYEYIRVTYE